MIPFIFTDIQRVTTWLLDKSNGVCFVQRWLVYSAVVFWIVPRQGHLVLVTVSFTILFVPITAMRWPSFGKFVASLTNILFMTYYTSRDVNAKICASQALVSLKVLVLVSNCETFGTMDYVSFIWSRVGLLEICYCSYFSRWRRNYVWNNYFSLHRERLQTHKFVDF